MNMDVEFLRVHGLSAEYSKLAQRYLLPVVRHLVQHSAADTPATQEHAVSKKPLWIGINGAQGSGKSTLADLWVQWCRTVAGIRACSVSIDDFYLTHHDRQQLAATVHPLLATRGVPGTHDVAAGLSFYQDVCAHKTPLAIPRFNKAQDDPFPENQWPVLSAPVDVVFFEGWCVGSLPQSDAQLMQPINALEADEDPQGIWRTYVNAQLAGTYQNWFDLLDYLILLEAPSFDCVAGWRWQQEEKLRARLSPDDLAQANALMDRPAVNRFVSFYERITRDNLARLPARADVVFSLTQDLSIHSIGGRLVRSCSEGEFAFGQ